MNEKKTIRYFSMFTGVGGFEIGLEAHNIKPLSEIEQDWERRNWAINQQGTLLCFGSIPTLCERTNGLRWLQQADAQRKGSCENIKEQRRMCDSRKFTCVGVSEIDKYASELLANKFPSVKNWGDCTKINPSELPDFDMLCGGFPCQAFSIAGKRRGFKDTRGTLFFEIARILEVKRPRLVLLENVKGLLNHNKGKTFKKILQTLSELGYDVQWMVLNSKFFGVPQNRERVFIIGNLGGTSRPEILPFREINEKVIELQGYEACTHTVHARITADSNGTYIEGGGPPQIMDLYNRKEHTDRCPALTEPHHNNLRVREGTQIRRLTPTECERLQGFPDGWTKGFSNTQRYKMMGNAVTVNVIKAIAEMLL